MDLKFGSQGLLGLTLLLALLPGVRLSADSSVVSDLVGLQQKYVGSYDTEALLNEAQIRKVLVRLLGDDLNHFLKNLDVSGRVDLISGSLSITGNAIHGGGEEEAVFCLATTNGRISAAIYSRASITVYSQTPDYAPQSLCIKDWITLVNSGHRDRLTQPANVTLATGF